MNTNDLKKTSKFLSLVLRHQPELINLTLDRNGWASVAELLEKVKTQQINLDFDTLKHIVEHNDKTRFAFSPDYTQIRANQGHSITIDLGLTAEIPPNILFHGTALKNVASIKEKGLIKGERHHVHLSTNQETATKVGMRHGKPTVLIIDAASMVKDGILFYLSENGVWLTDHVPTKYIQFDSIE